MSAQPETWRVSTIEGVFEADLETLRQWILEGCVQPTDKVTKGNLNWIEAGKAPLLRSAFAGEATAPKVAHSASTEFTGEPVISQHSPPVDGDRINNANPPTSDRFRASAETTDYADENCSPD